MSQVWYARWRVRSRYPIEMAMPSNTAAVQVIKSMPEYVALFQTAFPKDTDSVTHNNMALAIGAFERGLVTPSAWDAFLNGDKSALTDAQKSGFNTFAANPRATRIWNLSQRKLRLGESDRQPMVSKRGEGRG